MYLIGIGMFGGERMTKMEEGLSVHFFIDNFLVAEQRCIVGFMIRLRFMRDLAEIDSPCQSSFSKSLE